MCPVYVYFGRYLHEGPIIPSRSDSQNVLIHIVVGNLLMQDTHLRFCGENCRVPRFFHRVRMFVAVIIRIFIVHIGICRSCLLFSYTVPFSMSREN